LRVVFFIAMNNHLEIVCHYFIITFIELSMNVSLFKIFHKIIDLYKILI